MGCGASSSSGTVSPSRESSTEYRKTTVNGSVHEIERNAPQSPKRKRKFGEFPTPQLLQDANLEYAIEKKRKSKRRDSQGQLVPLPTAESKADLFQEKNFTKLDARATDTDILKHMDGSLEEFVKFICKHAKKDIEKARVLFLWLATFNLFDLDEEDDVVKGSVREELLRLHHSSASHSSLYIKMCRLAKLEAREIRGFMKSSTWEPGDQVTDEDMGSWVAVAINKSWRLFDPHWASRATSGDQLRSWHLIDDNGNKTCKQPERSDERALRYHYDDFYFMTDPEAFIYSHMPLEEKWQLLARSVTRREFNQLANLRPAFFRSGLRIKSHRKCTLRAPKGEVDIKVEMPHSNLRFMHQLWMSSGDMRRQTLGDLTRFVFRKLKGNEMQVHLEFPAPGKYKFELYVNNGLQSSTLHQIACTYVIYSEAAKDGIQPLPENDRREWGPGLDLLEAGLEPIGHDDAVVEAEHGVKRLKFKVNRDLDLIHTLHSNKYSKSDLENFVVHHREGDEVTLDVKLPSDGEYALNLFAKDAGQEGKLSNVCSYLLTSDQGAFDVRPFPAVPNGFAGVTPVGREARIKCISHKTAMIEAPESGELDIDLKLPPHFKVMGKLSYQADDGARSMDKYMMTTVDQKERAKFSMRLPEAGFYSLRVFGASTKSDDKENVYNFLIHVATPKVDCPGFPTTTSEYRDNRCRVHAPLTGTLPANQNIPFAIMVPGAEELEVISSKGWQSLVKCEDGMWRGDVQTGEPASELKVAAKLDENSSDYTTLLTYGVHGEKEIIKETQVQQTKHKQAKKKLIEQNTKKQERNEDIQQTHKALLKALEARDSKELSALLKYIQQKRYVSRMEEDVTLAKEYIRSLERIEKLQKAILSLDAALISEIRRYAKPPKLVHEVMVASLLLLGDHEGKTRDWTQCQKLCNTIGPQGLLRRVREFDVQQLHPEIAAQANMLISQYRLDDVQDKSAGAATFFCWTMGMTEEVKMLKSGAGRATPAGLRRQKDIFGQAKFKGKR